jgi:hypothetical protein
MKYDRNLHWKQITLPFAIWQALKDLSTIRRQPMAEIITRLVLDEAKKEAERDPRNA